MAYHHHHHGCAPPQTNTTCCCNSGHCCSPPPHLSPPSSDPLLQALAGHILQSVPANHGHDPYLQSSKSNARNLHSQSQYQHLQRRPQNPRFQEISGTHSLISSLLQRIDALESSLQHFSSSPSYRSTLRDLAARVIQTHFRAFLVRRSRTLRQLKELALVKSTFNSVKSSLSGGPQFEFDALSRKVMDLLLRLDSIQGGDPMIRDGKRSLSRDLVRFLESVEEAAVERHGVSLKTMKNVRFGYPSGNKSRFSATNVRNLRGQREMIEKLRARVENISRFSGVSQNDEEKEELEGFQEARHCDDQENPRVVISRRNGQIIDGGVLMSRNEARSRVKKRVSFADDGNIYRVFSSNHEPISSEGGACLDESVSSDDQGELVENLCSEVEELKGFPQGTEDEEEAHVENGGSPQTSDEERNLRRIIRSEGNNEIRGRNQGRNGGYVFSAPMPVKMESKDDLMKKRSAVKIVT